jgi:hypothetical protein
MLKVSLWNNSLKPKFVFQKFSLGPVELFNSIHKRACINFCISNLLSRSKKTLIVDVVMVNSVVGLKGWKGVEGVRIKGWAVPTRQGTRVDGDSPP